MQPSKLIGAWQFQVAPEKLSKRDRASNYVKKEIIAKILTIPIDFMYFSFCCPFRLKFSSRIKFHESQKGFVVCQWLPHVILCGVISIIDCLWMLKKMRDGFPINTKEDKNPVLYVDIFGLAVSSLNKLLLIRNLWVRQEDFLQIANFVHTKIFIKRIPSKTSTKWSMKAGILVLCLLYTLLGIVNWTGFRGGYDPPHLHPNTSQLQIWLEHWWSAMVKDGRELLFLPRSKNYSSLAEEDEHFTSYSTLDVAVGLMASVGVLQR